jgi:hypothetical protein
MLKVVFSAVFFVVLVALVLVFINKVPQVKSLARCYEEVSAIYREDHIVTRRAYTNNATICERNKKTVLKGVECFYKEEARLEAMDWEIPYLKKAAQVIARTTNEPEEVISDHNEKCEGEDALIEEYELEDLQLKYSL